MLILVVHYTWMILNRIIIYLRMVFWFKQFEKSVESYRCIVHNIILNTDHNLHQYLQKVKSSGKPKNI